MKRLLSPEPAGNPLRPPEVLLMPPGSRNQSARTSQSVASSASSIPMTFHNPNLAPPNPATLAARAARVAASANRAARGPGTGTSDSSFDDLEEPGRGSHYNRHVEASHATAGLQPRQPREHRLAGLLAARYRPAAAGG